MQSHIMSRRELSIEKHEIFMGKLIRMMGLVLMIGEDWIGAGIHFICEH